MKQKLTLKLLLSLGFQHRFSAKNTAIM